MNTTPLDQLTTFALLGVAHKPSTWPTLPGKIGALIATLDNSEATIRLLQTAGVLALAAEFASEPISVSPNAIIVPAPEETLPVMSSQRLYASMSELIDQEPVEIIVELVHLLAAHRLRLPAEFLPMLLDTAVKKPLLREAIAKLPGLRQRWLAGLNPQWAVLRVAMDNDNADIASMLEHGTAGERVTALRRLRVQTPDQARLWLINILPQASAQERQELLTVIQDNLTIEDETLLESLLQDRAKGVRQLAGQMLSCLPESKFAQRMASRLDTSIRTKQRLKKIKLEFELPETLAATWKQDGIEEQPTQGEGAKAFWLRQLVSFTHLSWWKQRFNCTPEQIVELCSKSEWRQSLISGLADATLNQHNTAWANILFKIGDTAAMLKIATPSIIEAQLTAELKDNHEVGTFLAVLYTAQSLPSSSVDFGNFLISNLRKHMWDLRLHTLQLQTLALQLPSECLAATVAGWDSEIHSPALQLFLHIARLRLLIHQEFVTTYPHPTTTGLRENKSRKV